MSHLKSSFPWNIGRLSLCQLLQQFFPRSSAQPLFFFFSTGHSHQHTACPYLYNIFLKNTLTLICMANYHNSLLHFVGNLEIIIIQGLFSRLLNNTTIQSGLCPAIPPNHFFQGYMAKSNAYL